MPLVHREHLLESIYVDVDLQPKVYDMITRNLHMYNPLHMMHNIYTASTDLVTCNCDAFMAKHYV